MNDSPNHLAPAPPQPRRSPLFWLNVLFAVGLLALLLASPFLVDSGSPRIIRLFAQDSTVRKTALAAAMGLTVTAFVFFRSRFADARSPSHRMPPSNVVGA